MHLAAPRYGKDRVRVLRVRRGPEGRHEIDEVEVSVALEGDFNRAYLESDNGSVVPTDTMKNTVHILARDHLAGCLEDFGLALGRHFLKRYEQIARVCIKVAARPWQRYRPEGGKEHPHAFVGQGSFVPFTEVELSRSENVVRSGCRDLLILKSTASAFTGFPRCEYTSLPETDDRILATQMEATWTFTSLDADFVSVNAAVMAAMLESFADEFSPSVQRSLYLMAVAALAAAPTISEIKLTMPNKHYLPINLQGFGIKNENEIFLPTDEPHGQIEATISREKK